MSAHKNRHVFSTLSCHNLHFSFANKTNTCAEIHGESCKAYRMKLSPLKQKIFMNIQLGVTCVDMVDFYRSGHIYVKLLDFVHIFYCRI